MSKRKKYNVHPWRFEAQGITNKELARTYIYQNRAIKEFLDPYQAERKFFLIGSKGCGKTLLLHYKAYLYFNEYQDDRNELQEVNTSHDLVESLDFHTFSLPETTMRQLCSLTNWRYIWEFAIFFTILRKSKLGIPPEYTWIEEEFKGQITLSNVVSKLLNKYGEFINSPDFLGCRSAMAGRISQMRQSFVLFVDRADQALNKWLLDPNYDYLKHDDPDIILEIWRNAQYALLEVCYNLTTGNSRFLKIYASARREALSAKSPEIINVKEFCVELDYTPEELRDIFVHNILITDEDDLWGKKGDPPIQRFLGFNALRHIEARKSDGSFQEEDSFDFLLRHSFKRPREIVLLGKRIHHRFNTRNVIGNVDIEDHIESVRDLVTEVANSEILTSYKQEFIKGFDEACVEVCVEKIFRNSFRQEQLDVLSKDEQNYLYRAGILGYVDGKKQKFAVPARYLYDQAEALPSASWYLLHPTLDRKMQTKGAPHAFYDQYNIIGDGYQFRLPEVYTPGLARGNTLRYFLPNRICGNGNWESAKITVTPEELYLRVFINDRDEEAQQIRQARLQDAFRMLAHMGMLQAMGLVEKKFGKNQTVKKDAIRDEILNLQGNTNYSTKIKTIDGLGLALFTARLFGRIVVAGSLLYLNYSIPEVCHIVRTFSDQHGSREYEAESYVRFLRKSFFLHGLPMIGPLNAPERENLLAGLSNFEVEYLKKWWRDFSLHEMTHNGNFLKEEKHFLRDHYHIN